MYLQSNWEMKDKIKCSLIFPLFLQSGMTEDMKIAFINNWGFEERKTNVWFGFFLFAYLLHYCYMSVWVILWHEVQDMIQYLAMLCSFLWLLYSHKQNKRFY